MLHDYSACQVQLSADTLATATSASDLASPASADVRSAAERRDELAPFHCPVLPVLLTEKIAHLGTAGDCCAAGFQFTLCRVGV
jgi:hypothetical protein